MDDIKRGDWIIYLGGHEEFDTCLQQGKAYRVAWVGNKSIGIEDENYKYDHILLFILEWEKKYFIENSRLKEIILKLQNIVD